MVKSGARVTRIAIDCINSSAMQIMEKIGAFALACADFTCNTTRDFILLS